MPISPENFDQEQYQRIFNEQPYHLSAETRKKNALLTMILKPLDQAKYTAHFSVAGFMDSINKMSLDYGAALDMTPDFQRGHVWTMEQKENFIRNVLRGAVPESVFVVQFNCASWDNLHYHGDLPQGFQCIDGLQRISAFNEYLAGKFTVDGLSAHDLQGSSFQINRGRMNFIVQIFAFQNKRDLLAHYLAINSGGTPHSESEIERIKAMMKNC